MSIRLDWEIEAEQEHVRGGSEDPEAKRRRRAAQLRFWGMILFVLLIVGGLIGGIALRLRYVDWQIEQLLRDTVDAEVAYLRIGDQTAFLANQRSASSDWLISQLQMYEQYQTIKTDDDTQLTGQVLDVAVDGQRGRVQVQEIIDGTPYTVAWFYWRYEDGWRHVPQDTTFWGEVRTTQTPRVTAQYRSLDQPLAEMAAERITEWIDYACGALICGTIPTVTLEIAPRNDWSLGWAEAGSWTLRMPSPYLTRTRADVPFDPNRQLEAGTVIAERIVDTALANRQMEYPADAYYLRQAVVSWMVGRFVGIQTNSFLVDSFAQNYGNSQVGQLVAGMQPNSSIVLFSQIAGAPIESLNVDWRDYLTWRLRLEAVLVTARNEAEFAGLYDINDSTVGEMALSRFNNITVPTGWVVVSASRGMDGNQVPILRTVAQVDQAETTQEIIFRLVDGVWKRAS
jgi:hypothetical protein